ncbi:hypothetical protein Chor_010357 [Crotalus horridus]
MGSELGRITFVFETICSADCVLYFMVDINKKSTNVVESWSGAKGKQSYAHIISKNASFTFTWAFQRTNQGQDDRSACYNDCMFSYVRNNQSLIYDFSRLSRVGSLMNGPSFTARGTKFFHFFNISLCGSQLFAQVAGHSHIFKNYTKPGIICAIGRIHPFICKARATVETTLGNVNIKPEVFEQSKTKLPDVHFYYKSSGVSATCENGRVSVVTMRCNPTKLGQGGISVPRQALPNLTL